MNTKKSNLLNWRNKRTTETADPKAKVVLSDDTFVDFSEITTDVELEKVEEEVEQLSEVVTEQGEQLDDVEGAVSVIESKIPTEASSQNQLADKDFVNESVATASADFKGTYETLQELEQVEANANDYGFVIVEDQYGNTRYDRYKYTEGEGWLFEYSVNSVQFSNAQWNAINSGIVDSDVTKLNALPTASQLQASFNSKVDKEIGKGLSTNDYTDAEKNKLSGIAADAEANVQGNWNETDSSSDAYIQNKPTNVSTFTNDAGYLTQHQDISSKADKSEMSVTTGTGADADKTTIQLKSGTSATVLNAHQQLKTINNESITGSGNITIVTDTSDKADKVDVGDKANLTTTNKSTLVAAINEVNTKATKSYNTIGEVEVFSTSKPYQVGDYVMYEDKLYKFTSNHSAGAWNSNDVEETTVVDELVTFGEATNEQINVILTREGEDIATQFDSSSAYSIDDYVFYNGNLYRFTSAHTAGDAWDATEVAVMGSKEGVAIYFDVEGEALTAPAFDSLENYLIGDFVTYDHKVYKFVSAHSAGAWDSNDVVEYGNEGDSIPRTVHADADGRASTIVAKGLLVNVFVNAIQGYYNPDTQQIRTALPMRNLYIPYITDLSGDYENMLVTFSYADPNNSAKAGSITVNVFTDSTRQTIENTFTVTVNNDEARFAVLHGKYYSVTFPTVDVYAAIGTINFKAKYSNRQFTAYYFNTSLGFDWIKYDGGIIGVQQVKPEDEPNIAGLLVHAGNIQCILSKNAIVAIKKADDGRRDFPLSNYTSENAAITDIDGQNNTNVIYQLDQDTGQTSADTFAAPYAKQQTLTFHIGGEDVSYSGFIPAYGLFKFLINNYDTLVTIFGTLGKTFPSIKAGVWMTSTEYNNTFMTRVSNGAWAGETNYHWKENALGFIVVFPIINSGDDD